MYITEKQDMNPNISKTLATEVKQRVDRFLLFLFAIVVGE
jgi:hypothetical protein